jgi:cell shape-determining protein MreC
MNYLLKTKPKQNSSFRRAFAVVVIVLLVISVLFFFQASFPFRVLGNLAEPLWKVGNMASSFAGSHLGYFQSKKTLIEENQNLRDVTRRFELVTLERNMLQEENNTLKNIQPAEGEVARVLTSPSQSFYDILLVELSPESEISSGDMVYGEYGILLGTVVDRTGSFARIELFSSNGRLTPVRLNRTGAELVLVGKGGGNFMVVVPRAFEIYRGDGLIFPALSSGVVASVMSTEDARTDSFTNVYASVPVNIFTLEWVRILHE